MAVLAGGWLAVKTILERGPTITISFKTGEGLEAGKTKIKYRDVDVGLVKEIALAADRKRVVATAELSKDAEDLLVADTRFWAVRPRITAGGVSGLGTLLSGPYIAVDPGRASEQRREFVALDVPPIVTSEDPGREFVLRADDLGSHDVGVPVYFRRLPVGEVVSHELDQRREGRVDQDLRARTLRPVRHRQHAVLERERRSTCRWTRPGCGCRPSRSCRS